MQRAPARHRKHSDRPSTSRGGSARHRKSAGYRSRKQNAVAGRMVMAAGSTVILAAAAAVTAIYWSAEAPHALGQVGALGRPAVTAGSGAARQSRGDNASLALTHSARRRPEPHFRPARTTGSNRPAKKTGFSFRSKAALAQPSAARPTPPVYQNPLRSITGLIPERVDMGADYGGAGPIYAIGDAVITNATASSSGWPGGGWITYQLTSGPAAGLQVYVAEDVTPTVSVGQTVTSGTVIANMYVGGAGIETGWAMPDGFSAESQLAVAGAVSGGGPFPTEVGLNFDALLQALGVPSAPNFGSSGYGVLPSNYPTNWSSLISKL